MTDHDLTSDRHPTVDLPAHLEGPRLPTTYTASAFLPLTVYLLNEDGAFLSLDDDLDARPANRLSTVREALAFIAEHEQGTAYRATDDCVTVAETVTGYRVYEGQQDVTSQIEEARR